MPSIRSTEKGSKKNQTSHKKKKSSRGQSLSCYNPTDEDHSGANGLDDRLSPKFEKLLAL